MTYNGVAISGKAAAGKNYFAAALSEELVRRGMWPFECGFADALKDELLRDYGLTKEMPGGREKLVDLGHGRRQEDPNYWVKKLACRLDSLIPAGAIPVVTDMRYESERKWAVASGYLTVRIDALRMDRLVVLVRRGEDPDFVDSEHPTETELDEAEFDVRFWNPHSLRSGVMRHFAVVAADKLDGTVEMVA